MVKSLRFANGVEVPVPGFGAMGISFALGNNLSYEEAEPVELDCTFWDTAMLHSRWLSGSVQVSYSAGLNEKIVGDFIRKHNCRDKIFDTCLYVITCSRSVSCLPKLLVASKCGIAVFEDGEGTIDRLGFTPGLYCLHRIDANESIGQTKTGWRPETTLEESISELHSLRTEGKTKYIGLSEAARIDVVQAEYSAFETIHESDGLVSTARELDIAYVAYGPLGHGWSVDDFPYETPDDFELDEFRRQKLLRQQKDSRWVQAYHQAQEVYIATNCTCMGGSSGDDLDTRIDETQTFRRKLGFKEHIINRRRPQGVRYNEVAVKDIGN
ncbi:hypothetical protein N7450_002841 [Penicillium hetheringtonii]|uniref:NADP-dependent oxidoreductase domain-containing protein n=1 Tax=Penicillium hetheringtonii TaxID=911720 RepID=A0AAD6DWM9_9EURO|nr:hypothetical protein N7450_002841 [Penicillium hetheringtonii]